MSDNLDRRLRSVAQHFAANPTTDRIKAIDAARAAGATWQQIADAAGFTTRQAAHRWYTRHNQPHNQTGPTP